MEKCSLDFNLAKLVQLDQLFMVFWWGGGCCFVRTAETIFLDKVRTFIFMNLKRLFHNATRRVCSPVTMWIHTRARGTRDILPQKFWLKNGAIWCILGLPKYVIINL